MKLLEVHANITLVISLFALLTVQRIIVIWAGVRYASTSLLYGQAYISYCFRHAGDTGDMVMW